MEITKNEDCFEIVCSLLEAELIRVGLYKMSQDKDACLKEERRTAAEAFKAIDKAIELMEVING